MDKDDLEPCPAHLKYSLIFMLRTSNLLFLHLAGTADEMEKSEMEKSHPSLSHALIQEVECF